MQPEPQDRCAGKCLRGAVRGLLLSDPGLSCGIASPCELEMLPRSLFGSAALYFDGIVVIF